MKSTKYDRRSITSTLGYLKSKGLKIATLTKYGKRGGKTTYWMVEFPGGESSLEFVHNLKEIKTLVKFVERMLP